MLGLCCLWLIQGVAGLCHFPSYLQTNVTRGDASLERRELVEYRQRHTATADDDVKQGGGRGRAVTLERRRDWRSGVRDQATSWTTTLTFDGALMIVERVAAATTPVVDDDVITARSFQCKCLEEINGNSYLIRHQLLKLSLPIRDNVMLTSDGDESVDPINYACVQFVRRSASVVQLRISASTSKQHNRTLCDDAGLRWEKWLIVDMAAMFHHHSTSLVGDETGDEERYPLSGGFSVRVFKAESRGDQGVCDGYRRAGDTRIEVDCVPGDGLYFYFWSAACVPPGAYMYATQSTVCRASWSDDVYTYVVLTHNRLSYAWLFRYPAVLVADSFTAHLLQDLAADDSPHATWTGGKHWRLDMVRDVQRPVTSLCVDDLDACRSWSPQLACGSSPSMALACPRTCGVCNESRPVVCTFRSDLVGDWVALADPDQTSSAPSVVVDASTMTVRSGGGVMEKFHCVTWTDERGRLSGEEMVVTEHFNGCRPRYTCIRYQRRAVALLQLKLSQSRMWPLVNAVDQPVDCRAFSYDDDDSDSAGRQLRGQRFRLLYSREPRPPTACQLPLPPDDRSLRNYTLVYNNGTQCRDASVTEALDGFGLLFSVGDCGPGVTSGTRTTLLHCMKSSRLSTGDGVAIVTRSASTPTDIRCWFYATTNAEPEMYWLAAAHCGAVVRRLGSSANRLQHFAVLLPARRAKQFRHQADHVTSTWSPQRHLPANRRSNDDLPHYAVNTSDASPMTPDFGTADTNSAPETETDAEEEPTNVFVVFAAMVIFTLLQIPCNLYRVSA